LGPIFPGMEDDSLEKVECAEYGFRPRLSVAGFLTSEDDLGKTKRSLGLGAAYLVSSWPKQTKTSGQDLDKVLLV
jgi:hypothetical protein